MEILCSEQDNRFNNGEKFQSLREAMKDPIRLEELKQEIKTMGLGNHLKFADKMQFRKSYIGDIKTFSPNPEMIRQLEEMTAIIDEQREEKERKEALKEQREIAQTHYLKNISENTDFIANQFKITSISLITLNNIMARAEVTFSDIQKDVEESKAINAEIFEILAKTHISNEQERLKATESLLTKIQDKAVLAELPANIMAIIDVVTNLPQ